MFRQYLSARHPLREGEGDRRGEGRVRPWILRSKGGAQGLLLRFCLLLLFLLASPVQAQTPAVEEVAQRLEEAAELVERGEVSEAKALLSDLTVVRLDDGSEMALESEGWIATLEEKPQQVPDLLRQAAHALRDPPSTLPADARQRLQEVLARPEFQPAQPTLWQRIRNWLADLLADLLFYLPRGTGSEFFGELLIWIIVGISGLVVAGVLFSFLRGLRQNLLKEERIEEFEGDIPLYASQAQQRATEAARGGDFREAMRLLYLAALLHLDEVGLIRFDRALTNREVLASVAHNEPLRALLAPVVTQFDRVWYGHAPFGASDFEQVTHHIEQLRAIEG